MQFSKTFTFMTMAAIAAAAQSFTLLVIRSGSDVQYNTVVSDNGSLYLKSGNRATTYVLTDDNALYDSSSKKYVTVKDNAFVESDTPDKGFGSSGGHLTYKDGGFSYEGNPRKLVTKGNEGVALRLWEPKEVSNPEEPSPSTSTASTQPSSTSLASSTQTAESNDGKVQFGVITIRSGSKFQNGPIKKVDSHPHVFAVGGDEGSDITFTLSPDGTMVDQDGRGVNYDSNTGELGSVAPGGKPSQGFSIKNGALFHDDKDNWKACPSGNSYSLADNDCTGGTPLLLKVVGEKKL